MELLRNYQTGINLGGWISQYERGETSREHFKTFLTEKDIRLIASWGVDHVRLPFDYDILEEDHNPFVYKEEGFEHIDACLEWCRKAGLNVVLDFHHAPGQISFPADIPNPLFVDPGNEARFHGLWREITRRYLNIRDNLIFEILNEAVEPTSYRWNKFYRRAVEVIREIDGDRRIIIGGVDYNSVAALKELELLEDPNIIYNFHFYAPFLFTHQRAHWCEEMKAYHREIFYPGEFPGLMEFLKERPEYVRKFGRYAWVKNDRNLMLSELQEVFYFKEYTGKPLYCGEFGVIDVAPEQSKVNWLKDCIHIMKKHKIARAFWTYKELDFGLVDRNGNIRNPEIVKLLNA